MSIQFIFSFHGLPQYITDYRPFFWVLLGSKEVLLSSAMMLLNDDQRSSLVKISMCVNCPPDEYKEKISEWYDEGNGKVWLDELELFRKDNGIDSFVPENIIREFMEVNS